MSMSVNHTPAGAYGLPFHDDVAARVIEDMKSGVGAALHPYPTMKVFRRAQREGFIILGNEVGR